MAKSRRTLPAGLPTRAIGVRGLGTTSRVGVAAAARDLDGAYGMLAELNIKPRTTYLAKMTATRFREPGTRTTIARIALPAEGQTRANDPAAPRTAP